MTDEIFIPRTYETALDYVRHGKPVPPEIHKATVARANSLPGSGTIPPETEEPLKKIYPGTGKKVWYK
jgi:hypothetical protein